MKFAEFFSDKPDVHEERVRVVGGRKTDTALGSSDLFHVEMPLRAAIHFFGNSEIISENLFTFRYNRDKLHAKSWDNRLSILIDVPV